MKRTLLNSLLLVVLLAAFLFACGESDELLVKPDFTTGEADFTNYVALGNSLTAGTQSGALYIRDSQYSYPNLIAQQADAETFVQPEIKSPGLGGFDPLTGTIYGVLELPTLANPPVVTTTTGNPLSLVSNLTAPSFNNLGIPGILLYDMLNATSSITTASAMAGGAPNAMVDVVLRGGGMPPIQQALAQNPTFITVWIGNNDLLGSVINGDVIPGVMPTDVTAFTALFTGVIQTLEASGVDYIVANLPHVTTIPYANYVSPYAFDPVTRDPILVNGNPIPWEGITDPDNSKVCLSAVAVLGQNGIGIPGSGVPLPDAVWLDPDELDAIDAAWTAFNAVISNLSSEYGFPLVGMAGLFDDAATFGLSPYGEDLTTTFITGGLFSLDGVHPSTRGYVIVTNEFIRTINEFYNSTLPILNPNDFPVLNIPAAKGGRPFDWIDVYKNPDVLKSLKAQYPSVQ